MLVGRSPAGLMGAVPAAKSINDTSICADAPPVLRPRPTGTGTPAGPHCARRTVRLHVRPLPIPRAGDHRLPVGRRGQRDQRRVPPHLDARYLRKVWDLGDAFTDRDAAASTFDHLLSRDTPRDRRHLARLQSAALTGLTADQGGARRGTEQPRQSHRPRVHRALQAGPDSRFPPTSPTPTTHRRQRRSPTSSSVPPRSTSRAWSPTTPTKPSPTGSTEQGTPTSRGRASSWTAPGSSGDACRATGSTNRRKSQAIFRSRPCPRSAVNSAGAVMATA